MSQWQKLPRAIWIGKCHLKLQNGFGRDRKSWNNQTFHQKSIEIDFFVISEQFSYFFWEMKIFVGQKF